MASNRVPLDATAPKELVQRLSERLRANYIVPDVAEQIESQGVQLITLDTARACEEYNRLVTQTNQAVVAGLHLTC